MNQVRPFQHTRRRFAGESYGGSVCPLSRSVTMSCRAPVRPGEPRSRFHLTTTSKPWAAPGTMGGVIFLAFMVKHLFGNVRTMDCERCAVIHPGVSCAASSKDAAGASLCIFCLDSVCCPIQKRIIAIPRAERSRWILEQITKGEKEHPTTTTEILPAERSPATPAAPNCKVLGCKTKLIDSNATGYCSRHLARAMAKTNGAALQILRQTAAKTQEDGMNGTGKPKSPISTLPAATSPAQVRTCKLAGCASKLSWNNTTGYCAKHHRAEYSKVNGHGKSGLSEAANGRGNGAVISKVNGHENSRGLAVEQRVALVLSRIPVEDKITMIDDWLWGRECA